MSENPTREIFEGLSRRGFLQSSAGALAALGAGAPQFLTAQEKPEASADSIILIWMAGGMAQTETFDPKTYTPFEPGLEALLGALAHRGGASAKVAIAGGGAEAGMDAGLVAVLTVRQQGAPGKASPLPTQVDGKAARVDYLSVYGLNR